MGFTYATLIAARAVGSYPTISPLPLLVENNGGLISVALSLKASLTSRPPPAGRYPALWFHGARTFLHCSFSTLTAAITRPAGIETCMWPMINGQVLTDYL